MSAAQSEAYVAIASQLSAALDDYALSVEHMVNQPLDAFAYGATSRQIDTLRLYAASLPAVSVQWVEVLIRHFEVTHCAWQVQSGKQSKDRLVQVHSQHREAVEALRRKSVSLSRLH
jgi:hypothetical protein